MIDIYLMAETEAELKSALPWLVDEDGAWIIASHQWALLPDVLIVTEQAKFDAAGNLTVLAKIDPRYHANLRLIDPSLLWRVPSEFRVFPSNPQYQWM